MANDKTVIGVKFDPKDRARIEREAKKDGNRSLSSLIRSIVIPEVERREREREKTDDFGGIPLPTPQRTPPEYA